MCVICEWLVACLSLYIMQEPLIKLSESVKWMLVPFILSNRDWSGFDRLLLMDTVCFSPSVPDLET